MRASVVLCTYNRAERLRIALESLAELEVPAGLEWELLVVDNNSKDETRQVVQQASTRLPARYVFEGRQGKSWALNTGIGESRGEIVVFTDDDVTFDRQWLTRIVEPFTAGDVLGVGGRIHAVWNGPTPSWWRVGGRRRLMAAVVFFDEGAAPIDLSSPPFGANMAFRREAFDRVGLFQTNLGPAPGSLLRGEDTELARRVMAAGRVVYAPEAVVFHPVEPERRRKSYFRRWYFDYGRCTARVDSLPSPRATWFGVPRYMYKQLLTALARAITMAASRDRFYWELSVYQIAGLMYEVSRSRRGADQLA
jgi:glycosyltransferase involved in cell wall biosynthesis